MIENRLENIALLLAIVGHFSFSDGVYRYLPMEEHDFLDLQQEYRKNDELRRISLDEETEIFVNKLGKYIGYRYPQGIDPIRIKRKFTYEEKYHFESVYSWIKQHYLDIYLDHQSEIDQSWLPHNKDSTVIGLKITNELAMADNYEPSPEEILELLRRIEIMPIPQ